MYKYQREKLHINHFLVLKGFKVKKAKQFDFLLLGCQQLIIFQPFPLSLHDLHT